MLRTTLIHPELSAALARAGHGSRVLISDGNYPHATAHGPRAERVWLNLSPGVVTVAQALRAIASAVPIEAAAVMDWKQDDYVSEDPPVWRTFAQVLREEAAFAGPFERIARPAFYETCRGEDLAVLVATGDQALYANLLLTIGVRPAES